MNLLEEYQKKQTEVRARITAGQLQGEQVFYLQELNYRVGVLETLRDLTLTAPVTMDGKVLATHFCVVDTYIRFLLEEHQKGTQTDEDGKRRRATAHEALKGVVMDYQRKFGSIKITAAEQYRNTVSQVINNVVLVWLKYRSTYVNL